MANTRIEEIDKEIDNLIGKIKVGQPTYSPKDLQIFRDTITKLNKEKAQIDHNDRAADIKVVKVANQPKGNSSTNAFKSKRFTVHPDSGLGGSAKVEL